MPSKLITEFFRIGRSGHTVDGREIKAEWIEEAAEHYDPELYKAQIWPDHYRWYNLGGVEELRAVDNSEGGKDLFAKLSPNEWYLQANKNGQKLFTSMELIPNFRKQGHYYLGGLGATDDPASAATTEIRFSAGADKDALMGEFVENKTQQFNSRSERDALDLDDDDLKESFMKKMINQLFKNTIESEDDEMARKDVEELNIKLSAISDALNKFISKNDQDDAAGADETELEKRFTKLETQFAALADKNDSKDDDDASDADDKLAQFKSQLDDLTKEFKAALKDESGNTEAGEHTGGESDDNQYI